MCVQNFLFSKRHFLKFSNKNDLPKLVLGEIIKPVIFIQFYDIQKLDNRELLNSRSIYTKVSLCSIAI